MNDANRRTFLKVVGASSVAAGAVAVVPAATGPAGGRVAGTASAEQAGTATALPAAATGSMVAYIHDVATGEIAVMVEGREITITDHELVAKLAHALHSAPPAAL